MSNLNLNTFKGKTDVKDLAEQVDSILDGINAVSAGAIAIAGVDGEDGTAVITGN